MIHGPKLTLTMLFVWCAFTSCERLKNDKNVKVTLAIPGERNKKAQIRTSDLLSLEGIVISEIQLDSLGNGTLEIDLKNPVFASVTTDDKFAPLYLSPGDNISISIKITNGINKIKYSGDEADVNEYLLETSKVAQTYENRGGKHPIELELQPFLARKDSLENTYSSLLDSLTAKNKLDKETHGILVAKNKMSMLFFQQNWVLSHYGIEADNPEIPAQLKRAINTVQLDTSALKENMFEYGMVLNMYFQSKIIPEVNKEIEKTDSSSKSASVATLADKKIRGSKYPKVIEEFFLAKNISYNLAMEGISGPIREVYSRFKKQATDTSYLSSLEKLYKKWLKIDTGKPAPNFWGTTPDGKKISLSDLKGKVVYVDIWATWCGPCKEEFKFAKQVEKQFKENNKVAFLFVSIDQDIAAWKKMVLSGQTPKGIHINQQQNQQPDAIWESYLIWGIPRYVLIDQAGKIVQTHAERPSSGEVPDLILDIMKRGDIVAR